MADGLRVQTLVEALDRASIADELGLRFVDRRERTSMLSWSRLARRAEETAAGLLALGTRPRERVALVFPTGEQFFFAFFGCLLAGAVPVPMYPPVRLGRLAEYHARTARMIHAAGCRLVLADRTVRRLLGETIEQARPSLGCQRLDGLPTRRIGSCSPIPVTADDLAMVQFSSGTTVDPKPVALTHAAVLAQVEALNSHWPDTAELTHSGVSWLPLYHDMGLIGCVFPALERVADLTLIGPEVFVARPSIWLRTISRYRATISPGPNFAYGLCTERIRDQDLEGVDLSSWMIALNGAETVSSVTLEAFCRRFEAWGFRREAFTPVYGLSEAALAVTFSPLGQGWQVERFDRDRLEVGDTVGLDSQGREIVSVGEAVPGFELDVRDGEGCSLGEESVGHVWVRGPSLMKKYLGRPEETERTLVDGWLDTGDLGFVFRRQLFLTGRAKDLVILRGRNYGPEEIETAVDRLAQARVGCTVATSYLPAGETHEQLVIFVETAKGVSVDAVSFPDAVREAVMTALGLTPDQVIVLKPGTLPRTSSGKLRRGAALARWRAGTLAPPNAVSVWHLAAAMARSGIGYVRVRRGERSEREPAEARMPRVSR